MIPACAHYGLGIIPWYTTINGSQEWCQPADADPATAASDRLPSCV